MSDFSMKSRFPWLNMAIDRIEICGRLVSNEALSIYRRGESETLMRWEEHCERLANVCNLDPESYLNAVDGYIKYSFEFIREQAFFLKKGYYRENCFHNVVEKIYSNREVMEGYYLDGLYLTLIFWPNHWRILRLYDDFLKLLPEKGRVLDIGTGHGYYLARLLSEKPLWHGIGIDISPYACNYAKYIVTAEGVSQEKFKIVQMDIQKDILKLNIDYHAIILAEIIEHVEDPILIIKNAEARLIKNGIVFFTTAINSAASDHIQLFKTPEEVKSVIRSSSLKIIREEILILDSHRKATHKSKPVPASYVAILMQ